MEILVGTYTQSTSEVAHKGEGIYAVTLDAQTGTFGVPRLVQTAVNPSWLCIIPDQSLAFAVNEGFGAGQAAISAYRLGAADDWHLLSHQPFDGDAPCHLAFDRVHHRLASAQYGSGDVRLWQFRDQELRPASMIPGSGSGPNTDRQEAPHAHFVAFTDHGNILHSVDLGADAIHSHHLDANGQVTKISTLATPPGSGPRHMAISADEQLAWVVCELDETILHLTRAGTGWQIVHIHPAFSGTPTKQGALSAIRLSRDEGFVYIGGRQQSAIAGFTAGGNSVCKADSGGLFPRDFVLSRCGSWVVAANQHSNTVAAIPRDPENGRLSSVVATCQIGSPVCVAIMD